MNSKNSQIKCAFRLVSCASDRRRGRTSSRAHGTRRNIVHCVVGPRGIRAGRRRVPAGLRVARIKVASQMFLFSLGIFANDETRNAFPTKLRDREHAGRDLLLQLQLQERKTIPRTTPRSPRDDDRPTCGGKFFFHLLSSFFAAVSRARAAAVGGRSRADAGSSTFLLFRRTTVRCTATIMQTRRCICLFFFFLTHARETRATSVS